jgi:hypothetical protein
VEASGDLFAWQTPGEMRRSADALSRALGPSYRGNAAQDFREAFVASRFASARGADMVRLLQPDGVRATPDFELWHNGSMARYETTEANIHEALNPSCDEGAGVMFTSLSRLVSVIHSITAKKAAKPYANCTGLVVYLSAPPFFFDPVIRWQALLDSARPASIRFQEVWIIRDLDRGALLWLNGKPQPETEF